MRGCSQPRCRLIVRGMQDRLHPLVANLYEGRSVASGADMCGIRLNGLTGASEAVQNFVLYRDALAIANAHHGASGILGLMALEWGEYGEAKTR